MKSLTRRIAIAAAVFATAGVIGANAADEPQQAAPAADATPAANTRTPKQEARFEWFERQEQMMSAPSYNPAEHPDAKPEPHSDRPLPSVWSDPLNTEELG